MNDPFQINRTYAKKYFPYAKNYFPAKIKILIYGRSTKTSDGHNVCDVIVTGFLNTVTAMSCVVTGNCHGFCWFRHRNFSARNVIYI